MCCINTSAFPVYIDCVVSLFNKAILLYLYIICIMYLCIIFNFFLFFLGLNYRALSCSKSCWLNEFRLKGYELFSCLQRYYCSSCPSIILFLFKCSL